MGAERGEFMQGIKTGGSFEENLSHVRENWEKVGATTDEIGGLVKDSLPNALAAAFVGIAGLQLFGINIDFTPFHFELDK